MVSFLRLSQLAAVKGCDVLFSGWSPSLCWFPGLGGASAAAVLRAGCGGGVVSGCLCADVGFGDGTGAASGVPATGRVPCQGSGPLHQLPAGTY